MNDLRWYKILIVKFQMPACDAGDSSISYFNEYQPRLIISNSHSNNRFVSLNGLIDPRDWISIILNGIWSPHILATFGVDWFNRSWVIATITNTHTQTVKRTHLPKLKFQISKLSNLMPYTNKLYLVCSHIYGVQMKCTKLPCDYFSCYFLWKAFCLAAR